MGEGKRWKGGKRNDERQTRKVVVTIDKVRTEVRVKVSDLYAIGTPRRHQYTCCHRSRTCHPGRLPVWGVDVGVGESIGVGVGKGV